MRANRWILVTLAVVVLLHLGMLSSLATGWLNPLFHDSEYAVGQGADFFSIYQAGERVRDGVNAYAETYDDSTPYAYPYRYVPAFLPVAVAFSLVPAWPAYWLWVALLEGLLVLNVAGTWRLTQDPRARVVATSLWLLAAPYYLELFMGQFSFIMATLIFWTGYGMVRLRPHLSGLSWGASLFVKSNTLLLAPTFWWLGRWRLLLGALAAFVLLNAPYFLLVEGSWDIFRELNVDSFSSVDLWSAHTGNLGFQAMLRQITLFWEQRAGLDWTWAEDRIPFYWAFVVGGVVALAPMLRIRRDPLLGLALAVSGYFLMFRDVWEHQFVMLIPVCVLLYLLRPRLRPWALACGVAVALPTPYVLLQALYGSGPDGTPPEFAWPLSVSIAYHGLKAIPVLILFGRVAWELVPARAAIRRRVRLPVPVRTGE